MKRMNKKGFTLVELLAVIVILAILMAIAAAIFFGVYGIVLLVTKEKLTKELTTQLWGMIRRRKRWKKK